MQEITGIDCKRGWQGKVSSKSCAAYFPRPVDKMVQLCSNGSFVEDSIISASITFIVLSWCNIRQGAIFFLLASLAYWPRGIMFSLQKTSLHNCSCSWNIFLATGSLHVSSWFCFKCPGRCLNAIVVIW